MPTKIKQKREQVKFQANNPITLTLDTNPSDAKETISAQHPEWGPSFTYFTGDSRVFFASSALHKKLLNYAKGDTVTVNKAEGQLGAWLVTSDGAGSKKENELQRTVEITESTILLRKIALDIDSIKSHLFGTTGSTDNSKPATDEDEIDF